MQGFLFFSVWSLNFGVQARRLSTLPLSYTLSQDAESWSEEAKSKQKHKEVASQPIRSIFL
jgi:hypothetical protein